ncbi:MAG TPA: hypothetical protein PLV50_06000 [Smithella sp.]|nr:hypothetical protein [Smithella sp.]HNY49192.1 hypothetical protein [Smithella sp.]HOG90068.1 hypothetical protein [Smithella sp.]
MKNEIELNKVCNHLKNIAENNKLSRSELAAIKKAAIALHVVYENNLIKEIEKLYRSLKQPLNKDQIAYLKSIGIETKRKNI